MFQFPARNSVCSDHQVAQVAPPIICGFNSPLGILFVRTCSALPSAPGSTCVSIPRSEFCLFGLREKLGPHTKKWKFQFPARNSVCSDKSSSVPEMRTSPVSIPRSEFCLFGQKQHVLERVHADSFNSPLGILFVRTLSLRVQPRLPSPPFQFPARNSVCSDSSGSAPHLVEYDGFNSPLGILFVRTSCPTVARTPAPWFQFPARNSVCSDLETRTRCREYLPCFNSPLGILFVRTC